MVLGRRARLPYRIASTQVFPKVSEVKRSSSVGQREGKRRVSMSEAFFMTLEPLVSAGEGARLREEAQGNAPKRRGEDAASRIITD